MRVRLGENEYIVAASASKDCQKDVAVVVAGLAAVGFTKNESSGMFELMHSTHATSPDKIAMDANRE